MSKKEEGYRLGLQYRTDSEKGFMTSLEEDMEQSSFTEVEKAMAFPLYAPRQDMATFLFKYELFKKIVNVHGCVVECGVAYGAGLMSFAQFSAILEPINYTRRIVGFDTFEGFPGVVEEDSKSKDVHCRKGGMAVDSFGELQRSISRYDKNRSIGHLPKVELVKGDATATIPQYVQDNPHLVVSLLYLDFDIYEPTVAALKHFLPRMPKGAVLAFDELCHPEWPGETIAVLESVGINNLRIKRVPFDTTRSYAVIE